MLALVRVGRTVPVAVPEVAIKRVVFSSAVGAQNTIPASTPVWRPWVAALHSQRRPFDTTCLQDAAFVSARGLGLDGQVLGLERVESAFLPKSPPSHDR